MQTVQNRTRIRIVQSRQNSRVKELRSALARGSRTDTGLVALEGSHLLEEAVRSGLRVATVFLREGSESLADSLDLAAGTELLALPPDVFSSAVTTESPQGIAALVEPRAFSLDDLFVGTPLILVAAALQDPGNLGTLVRSAEAFGATGLLALPGTVSLWNPKALRASSGSAFRLPVIAINEEDALTALRTHEVKAFAATVSDGLDATQTDLRQPLAFLIGNEGSGLPPSLVRAADAAITLHCPGPVESLNAAVAGSVLLFEAARQRRSS